MDNHKNQKNKYNKIRPLNTIPIKSLNGISVVQSKKLEKIGLYTVQDLLFYFPIRYEDRTHIYQIADLLPNTRAFVEGKIIRYNITFSNRKMITFQISDGSGILTIRFFNSKIAIKNSLNFGQRILVYGETKQGKYGTEMIHPEYYIQRDFNNLVLKNTLTPVYSTTEGIKQTILRKLINRALNLLDTCGAITELLPPNQVKNIISLPEALRVLHRPPSSIQLSDINNGKHPAKRRLIFEELLAHNLSMLALRESVQNFNAQSLSGKNNDLKNKLITSLPFKLTDAQVRVIAEIEHDMTLNVPMMRMVQGDVGSGKTLVAALVSLRAISHGKQVALMVPTEFLAEQHANNFKSWFSTLGVEVGWLTSKKKGKERLAQQKAIASGQVKMIVGTHAIFQEKVHFHSLALVIIDEHHRFGVNQRLALLEKGVKKGYRPHQLIMTATPIPRTLAMAAYADLDISIIDELPLGRIPIITIAIPNARRKDVIEHVKNACLKEGRQAYWVCTLAEKSSLIKAKTAKATLEELKLALPELNIGLVHGRMKYINRKEVMQQFKKGNIHLLVSTTVIEVGVDVSNASLMIIENSERFGLAQIHQLRGRVGRSTIASYCVLLYKSPLSKTAQQRLQILRNSNDGFLIAQKDLEIRGPGELLGTRQTGNTEFKVANLLRDQNMIPEVRNVARYVHNFYPKKAKALIDRWISKKNITITLDA